MASEWQKDRMTFKPHEFENGGKNTWIQRKNVVEIHETDPVTGEVMTSYEADMRFITNDEYNHLIALRNQEANDAAKTAAERELSLMEAMADIYEMLLN